MTAQQAVMSRDETLTAKRGSDFAGLSRQVKEAGLLERTPYYYALKIAVTGLLYAAGWLIFVRLGESWLNPFITAAFLAGMSTQLAFVGHDVMHKQVFSKDAVSRRFSLGLGNLLIGMSHLWWKDKHTRHHANPNVNGLDPDIPDEGPLLVTHRRARSSIGRALAPYQAYYFLPLLLLEGLNLHVVSVRAMFGGTVETKRKRQLELGLLFLHGAFYLTAVFTVLTPAQGLVFVAVNQGLFGLYMGLSFAPNHKGMQIFEKGEEPDFLRKQVLTSRNVQGGRLNWLVSLLLGGLNYQIEHHLFPSMPRIHLHRVRPIVMKYCKDMNVPYTEASARRSLRLILEHLHKVGATA